MTSLFFVFILFLLVICVKLFKIIRGGGMLVPDHKRKWKLFDSQREGKGVNKEDVEKTPGLKKFWRIYRENFFGRLLFINIIMLVGNLPLLLAFLAFQGVGSVTYYTPSGNIFSLLFGVMQSDGGYTPSSLAMQGVSGVFVVSTAATPWTYVLYGCSALTLVTWGFVSAGSAYVLRNMATERPIFILSDYFDTYRKNWRLVLPAGIIDVAVIGILSYNIIMMLRAGGSGILGLFFWVSVLLFLIWFIMRWYLYLQIVSFRISFWKMIKNSLYFVLLGIKRNLIALLGIALMSGVLVFITLVFGNYLYALSLGILLLTFFSTASFMAVYAAWYKIDEIMVIHDSTDETGVAETPESPQE